MTPGLHFHLAASVNAETGKYQPLVVHSLSALAFSDLRNFVPFPDIPLVPSLVTGDPDREPNFILHWLNNNEMHFSQQAESILQELHKKMAEKEEAEAQVQAHVDGDHDEHPLSAFSFLALLCGEFILADIKALFSYCRAKADKLQNQ